MATDPHPATSSETEAGLEINQAFVDDRQSFWGSFTNFVTGGAIAVAVLLIAMAYFLT